MLPMLSSWIATPLALSCSAGLFPPMVQKILIINVPRIFGPAWAMISRLLPQHHKDRIVLLTTSHTSAEEVGIPETDAQPSWSALAPPPQERPLSDPP